jgi:hypothetical protein
VEHSTIVRDIVKRMLGDSSFASSVGDCTRLQNQPAEASAEAGTAADQRLLKATAKGVMTGCASHSLSRVRLVKYETDGLGRGVLCVFCAILGLSLNCARRETVGRGSFQEDS